MERKPFDLEEALRIEEERLHRRRPSHEREHIAQVKCVTYFRNSYPEYSRLLFAVPNGGARTKTTAAKLKAEGVVAGVSDLILLVPRGQYHGLCIEMKTEKGKQSEEQKVWQELVTEQGYLYVVIRSFDDFIELTNYYLGL